MIKIDADKITPLFKIINYYIDGVNDTILSGDDGWKDSVGIQIEGLKNELKVWRATHLVATTPVKKIKTHEKYGAWQASQFLI